jgi:hypothetical protein
MVSNTAGDGDAAAIAAHKDRFIFDTGLMATHSATSAHRVGRCTGIAQEPKYVETSPYCVTLFARRSDHRAMPVDGSGLMTMG